MPLAGRKDSAFRIGFFDHCGRVAIAPQYTNIRPRETFRNGLCYVAKEHTRGYIDHTGKFVYRESRLPYETTDLSKWKLDTLRVDSPCLSLGRYYSRFFWPEQKAFKGPSGPQLHVDTADVTVYLDKYYAYKLYLINASADSIPIRLQDGYFPVLQEALNEKNEWQEIDAYEHAFCGNSYYTVKLQPGGYFVFAAQIYKGTFSTQLRFKWKTGKDSFVYSNVIEGRINRGQFYRPSDYTTRRRCGRFYLWEIDDAFDH